MSLELRTSVDIDAPPDRVWDVLTDLAAYPRWNPFIVAASGPVEPGGRLRLRMQPVGARSVALRPLVLEATRGRRLRWRGRLGVPGVLDAEHDFTLADRDGGVRLTQRETFRGLLAPLVSRSLNRHTLPAFHAMNAALKARVERAAAVRPG
jgi:hypothetical protein